MLAESLIPSGLSGEYEVHAATLTECADGTVIAAWFGGLAENDSSVKIWASRNEGRGWSDPVVVDDGNRGDTEYACWNPVLITGLDDQVYLYYKISGTNEIDRGYRNWWGAVKTSADRGKTWSERIWLPVIEPKGELEVFEPYEGHLCGPVKNRPLIMPDGSLLCGASTETKAGWRAHFELYQPGDWTGQKHGATVIGPLGGKEGIQPSFLVHSLDHQKLQVFTREHGQAWSEDGGRSWTAIEEGPIRTSKGLHAVTAANGWHFLAFNPSGRTPLSLARSKDGREWEVILPNLSKDGSGKMDYPSMLQAKDGKLHVVHTWHRSHIKHIVLDTAYLSGESD